MRNFIALSSVFVLVALLCACATSRVGVIQSVRIYQESNAGKAGLAYLEQVEQDVKVKAEAAQRLAESLPDNDELSKALQTFFVNCQEIMNNAQEQAVGTVQDLINRTIASYREEKRLSLIVQNDAAVSFDPNSDVTEDIIAEMNKSSVTFEPVSIPDFVPPVK